MYSHPTAVPVYIRVNYRTPDGRNRHVTPAFRDPADAEHWGRKIYGDRFVSTEPAASPNRQQPLELELEP